MEAGFSRMNCLTIIQASQGLAAYLLKTVPDASRKGVVIGYDSRHNSVTFAKLTAAAMVAKGIKVWWYEALVHTPLVPFAVNDVGAAAGVMVTASHNPARDNGYKVYWSNGCQISVPHDKGIAESILQNLEPVSWDTSLVENGDLLIESILDQMSAKYYGALMVLAPSKEVIASSKPPKFVYTPMHGVGLPFMIEAVKGINASSGMIITPQQAKPDPDFPTVKFPNPEEYGALDLAMATADEHNAEYVIATDPDADRLAVAQKVDGKWLQFTGNQLGIVLASYMLEKRSSDTPISKVAMLTTVVSSQMLSEMGRREGFTVTETLTGFKWVGNATLRLRDEGLHPLFAFEEAIGYMFPQVVCDKDGIAGAVVFLAAAMEWAARDQVTPWQRLQQLYDKYGFYSSRNTYFVSPDPAATVDMFESIRALKRPFPDALGTFKIIKFRDLTVGFDSDTPDNRPLLPVSRSSQMITCETDDGVKFALRGSGTEPKIKGMSYLSFFCYNSLWLRYFTPVFFL
jgi:phosphoglucomutase